MKFCDSHTDFLTAISSKEDREKYVKKIKACGGEIISAAVFTTDKGFSEKNVEDYSREIRGFSAKYKLRILLSIEDLGFVNKFEEIEKICALKPLSATLTWNEENQFGGGANSKTGLTQYGVRCVNFLEQENVLIDTAHMSRKSFWDFCKLTLKPIYNSHCNIFSLKIHARNLTDKQIKRIVKSGGFMGLTFYDKFISNRKIFCKDVAAQFDYLIKHFGADNFGIGSDLYGIEPEDLPLDFRGYEDLGNLEAELKKLGHGEKIIEKLFYKNFQDFLNRIKY